jgi:hypothetical protein
MDVDVDRNVSDKILDFCGYQMKYNIMGIGNECTHFVYAALFEVSAEDGTIKTHPKIQQIKVPFVWGRKLEGSEVRGGDIAQFLNHDQNLFIYSKDASAWQVKSNKRAPNHTGIVYNSPLWGDFSQYESHLHQEGLTRMKIRINQVYYESYGIVLTNDDMSRTTSTLIKYLKDRSSSLSRLLSDVSWGALRTAYGVDIRTADAIKKMIKSNQVPKYRGEEVAIFFEVKISGKISFFRPIVSDRRRNMGEADRAAEKTAVIKMMIRSGRKGHLEKGDAFGGDLKSERVKLGAFSWDYPKK